MKIGTKSILFGAHQFIIHPALVFMAWWELYGFPKDPRLWVMFIVHDWGYWGKTDIDGPEGKWHPLLGAKIMSFLFDRYKPFLVPDDKDGSSPVLLGYWGLKCLWHSRFMRDKVDAYDWFGFEAYRVFCVQHGAKDEYDITDFCAADKLALTKEPRKFYLWRTTLTEEIDEYAGDRDELDWLNDAQTHKLYIAYDHLELKKNDDILASYSNRQLSLLGLVHCDDTGDDPW